jgi:hypothetical protein
MTPLQWRHTICTTCCSSWIHLQALLKMELKICWWSRICSQLFGKTVKILNSSLLFTYVRFFIHLFIASFTSFNFCSRYLNYTYFLEEITFFWLQSFLSENNIRWLSIETNIHVFPFTKNVIYIRYWASRKRYCIFTKLSSVLEGPATKSSHNPT